MTWRATDTEASDVAKRQPVSTERSDVKLRRGGAAAAAPFAEQCLRTLRRRLYVQFEMRCEAGARPRKRVEGETRGRDAEAAEQREGRRAANAAFMRARVTAEAGEQRQSVRGCC